MTGEITLRGEVLQIGGLKEKLLAAHRGGIKTVLIPQDNVKDLAEIPDNIKNRLDIHPVKWIDQVLEMALERKPEPLPEPAEVSPLPAVQERPRRCQALIGVQCDRRVACKRWRGSCVVTIGTTDFNIIVTISRQLLDTSFSRCYKSTSGIWFRA